MSGQTSLISARGLTLAYGADAPAVERLDLDLPGGELVIVLGPNGGGKTTLFRAFTGELAPADGVLTVRGRLAYLPQYDDSRLDFPVSVVDVVQMGTLAERRPWQRPGKAVRKRSLEALERVGLEDRAKDSYGELSGGQRRRVLLARTIVQDAEILLLDEPLAGVDPASSEVIRATLDRLRNEGRLVIVASHDVDHARASDRVLCLNRRLIADGIPSEVMTDDALRETYASDLTVVTSADGTPLFAAAEHHHHHGH